MRRARVYYNNHFAGILAEAKGKYYFTYDAAYLSSPDSLPISLTLPLREAPFESSILFPAFVNLLSEGANKALQTRLLKIDENDYFGLLLATGEGDHIGPIKIKEDDEATSD
ncbi:MAG: HipA N-terminal domain-containing protein [Chitinophaga sp.]|uniref:HipA N-terminal domain-containing protein n=1 Tax=Chitinophaga sp. TaxID=1869181 RepID=UPI0025BADD52|nr:HipA N-terminal domain-containing protein [Chitinophaga sp.]MBV8254829.1 HipA N-terminal domain-containing protein [Chitinophaga sp.]